MNASIDPAVAVPIDSSSTVSLHFSLRLFEGEVVDSTFDGEPASLAMGDGSLPPGFERCLLGLRAGERATFDVDAADGFGEPHPENIQQFPRSAFAQFLEGSAGDAGQPLEPGMVVSFSDAAGGQMPGVVAAVDQSQVTVDFNHPLAGRRLQFEVEIISVVSGDGE